MTIANTKASNVFNANGVTRDFNLGFVYDENVSGISIKVIDSEGTETEVTSNYTIYNGVLTYPTVDSGLDPLEAGYKITIERLTPHTQTIDLIQQGPLDAETLEGGYDKLTMEVQELQDASDRSIKFPVQVEGETDAQAYIDELTALKDTATAAATTATSEAGIATTAATAAATSESNAEKWAEGTDAQVAALGGTHSAEGWAGIAQTAAESEDVQTVIANMDDINTVAGISTDVTEVASISSAVSNVATHDDDVLLVSDNMASVITTASNITSVNTVAAAASKVVTVADNISDVGTVADNVSDVSTVATDIEKVNTVATDIETIKAVNENKTNIDAVAGNAGNITAVAANATNINTVAADKTNIDAVAGNATNINKVAADINRVNLVADDIASVHTVAVDISNVIDVADNKTNIDAVAGNATNINTVAADSTSINAVAADLTNIDEVADDLTNIDTVVTNISDVNATGQAIEDVSAVAANLSDITLVANDLENIDEVATNVAQWQKPADWIDIRSGAIHNSIYALVGHSANYSNYNNFGFEVTLSDNSHSFEVYVDNVLQGTYVSGSTVSWNWSDLALTTGGTTTTPVALVTHTLRITPVNSEDTLKIFRVARNGSTGTRHRQGWLWVHFAISYSIERVSLSVYNRVVPFILTAVTALDDNLHLTGSDQSGFLGGIWDLWADRSSYLAYLPTIEVNSITNGSGMLNFEGPLKKAKLVVNGVFGNDTSYSSFSAFCSGGLNELEINKPIILSSRTNDVTRIFVSSSIKRLPAIDVSNATSSLNMFLTEDTNLEPTVLDFRSAKSAKKVGCYGTSANKMLGLKGLLVSNEAPFDDTGSPQINVSYTGLDRAALVNLFNSMPTVSASQVCNITGATGAADLTAEDLAIATNKGWTITR